MFTKRKLNLERASYELEIVVGRELSSTKKRQMLS
jgi:hypothetical protein